MQSQSSQVLSRNQPTQEVSFNALNSSSYQSSTTLCLSVSCFAGYAPPGQTAYGGPCSSYKMHFAYSTISF